MTKINAIPQIYISGGDIYYASRNLLIHLFFVGFFSGGGGTPLPICNLFF